MRVSMRVRLAVVALFVGLALASCGGPTCTQQINTSPGTIGTGQVFIVTNHSVYAPGDLIVATINNRLHVPIRINNIGATAVCPYFVLQLRADNAWQDIYECVVGGGDTQPRDDPKTIAEGGSFTSGVRLHTDLPTGTYRLLLGSYTTLDGVVGSGTAESATFRICACGVCS